MSVAMEYIAVIIYAVVGIITPLSKDVPEYDKASSDASHEALRMGAYSDPPQYAAR